MFAQPYGALPPVPTPRPGDDDDVWHVAISWDDVKVMSVEQLDDAFRLDIISSETMVWQKGMSGWQQLGVVAGIGGDSDDDDEDDEEDVLTVADVEVVWPPFPGPAKTAPVVRSARPTPAPPRPPSRAPLPPAPVAMPSRSQTQQAWPPLAPAPRPVSVAPVIPLAPRPVPTALMPPAPTASLMPPAGFGAPSALYQAANANAIPRHPPTVPPVAMSVTMPPPSYRRSSSAGRIGRWMLAFAFIGGLATTLYRNDILLEAAQKYGFEKQYLSAERAVVGSPGFGTLRSIAGLLSVEKLKLGSTDSVAPAAITAPEATTETANSDSDTNTDSADTKTESTPSAAETKTTTKAERAVDVGSLKLESATPKAKTAEAPASTKAEPKPAKKLSKAEARAAAKAEEKAAKAVAKAAAAKAAAAKVAAAKSAKSSKDDEAKAARALIEARRAKLAKEGKLVAAADEPKAEKAPKAAPKPEPAPKREAPAPVAAKPEKPTTAKGILDAAIRDSMEKGSFAPPKKKSKKSGPNADYDPMNGDL